jgi:NAD(P)-dependent dehydrogenase (short-subunit alcohol dehydrogenase family)
MAKLDGRVAIVTGAGGGLGRAHAMYLARQGAKVVVNDLAADVAQSVVDEIKLAGGDACAAVTSVTDEAGVTAMVNTTLERWGRVDILVNNAGILRDKSFAKMSIADFRLGSGLVDHSQKMTVAARATAEKKAVGQRS